jgi:hypothetical protein
VALLPRVVAHNWRLKLAALGLSVFLWALVQTEPRNAESFSVPVRVEVADTSWISAGPPQPAEVELRLSGPTGEIIRLAREGTVIRVPVDNVGSADSTINLRREWVSLGEGTGLSVESLIPNTVRIEFEPAVSRVLPVAKNVEGTLPEGLALASPIGLNPQVVRVRGPASHMEGLDSVHLRPLDLGTVQESGVYEMAVDTTGMGGIRVSPSHATLGIRVEEVVERELAGMPVQLHRPETGPPLVAEPATVTVRLRGARTLVTAVDPREITVMVVPELVEGLLAGEERRVPLTLQGVPSLVRARLMTETVQVRRASDGGSGRLLLQTDTGSGGRR